MWDFILKKTLIDVGMYNPKLRINEDIELRNRYEKYKIGYVELPLYRYTMHSGNMTRKIKMKFGNLKLYKNRPTIIAEVGVNHECKYKNVYKLINDAKIGGADAIKFQTYKAEK